MNRRRHLAFATATAPAPATADAGPVPAGAVSRARTRALPRPRPELLGLMVLTAVLNLWSLSQNGWANQYYSATVRSMTSSWHNFLYGSFDVSGVMTVDKPPLALWVQAISAKVFGFSSLSMLLPQALMGIAAVALVYDLTRRVFGRPAGFVAGLALATTPITVAISRHNNPDALLVLCCVAALWFVVRGLEDGRTRWIVLAGVAIGLGFETKMAAALIVAPGLYAAWLWVAPRGFAVAVRQTAASVAALVAVGAAWPLLIALTPASQRPWVSGTSDNSIWSLIVGYNGVGRLSGQAGGPGGMTGGGGGGAGGAFGGPAGVLRLFDYTLGAQAGWLIGFALVGGIGILAASRLRRSDARTGWLIASGGAFLGCAVAFSSAKGIFHPYYVSQLAPFTAVLVGGGAGFLLGRDNLARVLAPLAVALGAAGELLVLHNTTGSPSWAPPLVVIAAVGAGAVLAATKAGRVRMVALAVGLTALFAAPTSWAAQTLGHATNGTFPAGGPASSGFGGPGQGGPGNGNGRFGVRPNGGRAGSPPAGALPGNGGPQAMAPPGAGAQGTAPGAGGNFGGRSASGPFGGGESLTAVLAYVKAHGGGTIGVSSQTTASSSIIASGAKVAGLGGFSGRESEVSVAWLADAVRDGRIRWVLADSAGGGMGRDGRTGSSTVMAAVAKTCKAVTVSSSGTSATLYDCQGSSAALAALA
jgi:4-amino-4-deoxy-L-arabinose transferase-like glycosyltransferase